jgi:hypothetical protein
MQSQNLIDTIKYLEKTQQHLFIDKNNKFFVIRLEKKDDQVILSVLRNGSVIKYNVGSYANIIYKEHCASIMRDILFANKHLKSIKKSKNSKIILNYLFNGYQSL